MTAHIIDGKKISKELREELNRRAGLLKARGLIPGLATILVGDDPASHVYVASKIKACAETGITSFHHSLPQSASEEEIIELINKLNNDDKVHGILLQLPLPKGLNSERCLEAISPAKDADGLHPYNLGRLLSAKSLEDIEKKKLVLPCTPYGAMKLLEKSGVEIAGKNAVVIGRSNLVGKPISMLLLAANATVTIAHSKTSDIQNLCSQADILIAALGKPLFVKANFIKPGAAVIDVGINRTPHGLCGDVDFNEAKEVAGFITPVPGGVGPMTITMLMQNTINAAETSRKMSS